MNSDIRNRLNLILAKNVKTSTLLSEVLNCGETLIIGGTLREYKDNELTNSPRDIDIVVDTDEKSLSNVLCSYDPIKNRFGGYKIVCRDIIIDIWCLKNTWAYKEKIIKCLPNEYSLKLQDTVFLNVDAIVYNLTKDIWYDKRYTEAMKTRILDVVLFENPQLALNIVRTILLKRKYSMQLSDRLRAIICDFITNSKSYLQELMDAQTSHYKSTIISDTDLEDEISHICRM